MAEALQTRRVSSSAPMRTPCLQITGCMRQADIRLYRLGEQPAPLLAGDWLTALIRNYWELLLRFDSPSRTIAEVHGMTGKNSWEPRKGVIMQEAADF